MTSLTITSFFKHIRPYILKNQKLTIFVLGIILTQAVVGRLIPMVLGQAIDLGIMQGDGNYVFQMCLVFLFLQISKSILIFLDSLFFERLSNRIVYYLGTETAQSILAFPMKYFNHNPTGQTLTVLTDDITSVGSLLSDSLLIIITQSIMVVTILVFMASISLKLMVLVMVFTPIFILLSNKYSSLINKVEFENRKRLAKLNAFSTESLNGVQTIKLLNGENVSSEKFNELSSDYGINSQKSLKYYAVLGPFMGFFSAVVTILCLLLGAYLVSSKELEIGMLVAFMFHVQDYFAPLRDIMEKKLAIKNHMNGAGRVFELLQHEPEAYQGQSFNSQTGFSSLKVVDLNFSYEDQKPVLSKLNFEILNGQKIALIGRTGSGKTTLCNLIKRLYEPPANSLFLNDLPVESLDKNHLRKFVVSVSQDINLFKGTIAENIHLNDSSLTFAQAENAATKVGLLDLLKKSNRDLQTEIEESGTNLSAGERQLISIARAFVLNPQFLILDEATASVDTVTENLIHGAIDELMKNRSALVIAHRLSTIKNCDRILVLDAGKLVESGTHEELILADGLYAKMLRSNEF